jgi:hypothetical protein
MGYAAEKRPVRPRKPPKVSPMSYVATFESVDPAAPQWLRAIIIHDGKRYVGPTFDGATPKGAGKTNTPQQDRAARTLWAMIENMAIRR